MPNHATGQRLVIRSSFTPIMVVITEKDYATAYQYLVQLYKKNANLTKLR